MLDRNDNKLSDTYVYLEPSMTAIPELADQENKLVLERLLETVKLLSQKFGLDKDVKGRMSKQNGAKHVDIVLFNGAHGPADKNVDDQNVRPIAFLKSHGGIDSREKDQFPYWSNSIVQVGCASLNYINEGLKLLTAPDEEMPRIRAMARC